MAEIVYTLHTPQTLAGLQGCPHEEGYYAEVHVLEVSLPRGSKSKLENVYETAGDGTCNAAGRAIFNRCGVCVTQKPDDDDSK